MVNLTFLYLIYFAIMRAKEYLEINKNRILYYNLVKGAIEGLCPLRNNKKKTEEYFNRYLFADARILAKEKAFVLNEGEVDDKLAQDLRINILNAVCQDESFLFAYNIIVMQKNRYYNLTPLNFCQIKDFNSNTVSKIEKICSQYKEDYPKNNLMEYLLDDDNSKFYYEHISKLYKNELWWLNVFNEAYTIFDNIRLRLQKPFEAKRLITRYKNEDKDFENTVIDLVLLLITRYDYDLNEKQRKAINLLSKIIDSYFSQRKRQLYEDNINELENVLKEKEEEYVRNIETKDEIIEDHENTIETQRQELKTKEYEIAQLKRDLHFKGFSIPQQNLFYYYLFNELGVNFVNSKKKDWAKVISAINGKNEEYVRKELSINFDDEATILDMRIVATTIDNLFPNITLKILSDIEAQL